MISPYTNYNFENADCTDIIKSVDLSDTLCSCLHPIYKVITKNECTTVLYLPNQMIKVRKQEISKECMEKFQCIRVDHTTPIINYIKFSQIYVDDLTKPSVYAIALPCGRCSECLNRLVNRWAFRLKLDIEREKVRSYFLTLTFSPNKRTTTIYNVNRNTGEIYTRKDYSRLPVFKRTLRNLSLPFGDYINPKDYPFLTKEMEKAQKQQLPKEFYINDSILVVPSGFRGIIHFPYMDEDIRKQIILKLPFDIDGSLFDSDLVINKTSRFELKIDYYYYHNIKPTYSLFDDSAIKGELQQFNNSHGYLDYYQIQKFFKRLRRTLDYYYGIDKVKYFLCGEYSPAPHMTKEGHMTEGYLPHYHILLWFSDTTASCLGRILPKPKTNKRVPTSKLYGSALLPDGRSIIPALKDSTLYNLVFQTWGLCEQKGFNMSRTRSTEGCTRYISKYILKSVSAKDSNTFNDCVIGDYSAKYFDDGAKLYAPFERHMSKGIGKTFAQKQGSFIASNHLFNYKDGQYLRFYPSIMLKWIYTKYDENGKPIDGNRWYDNEDYFIMLRKREKFMNELKPKADIEIERTKRNIKIKTQEMFALIEHFEE